MQAQCLNCETTYTGNFCPECGQKKNTHRYTFSAILHDIPHSVFHIDKGLFFTFKELLIRPGKTIKSFIEGKRINYFLPFAYLFLLSAISSFTEHQADQLLHLQKDFNLALFPKVAAFFVHYPALVLVAMIPIISLWSWIFNLDTKYNYWENFIMNTYLVAQFNLFYILNSLIVISTHKHIHTVTPTILAFMGYVTFAYLQFFNHKFSFGRLFKNIAMFLLIAFTLVNCLSFTGFMTKWWWW